MAHNLYRFYLYTVFVAMLIFATVGLVALLQDLLALTALRGTYGVVPGNAELVRSAVFFGVSWLLGGLLGGLHYWLIRRDMHSDPDAGNSAIRTFFLNVPQLFVVPTIVGLGADTITHLGQNGNSSNLSVPIAITVALLAMVGVLEAERRRTRASSRLALFFQRLHLYGVQFIILSIMTGFWMFVAYQVVDALVFNGGGSGTIPCGGFVVCQGQNILSNVAAVLWVGLFWLIYGLSGSLDSPSLLRRIAHFFSFAYGAGFVLYGLYQLFEVVIQNIAGVKVSSSDFLNSYDFISTVLLGLLIASVYLLWLRRATGQNSAAWQTAVFIAETILAGLMAVAFYVGLAMLLLNVTELPVSAETWATSLSLIITGVGYIPLDIYLHSHRGANIPGALDTRRGFVISLLGGGILAGTIGGAIALYSLISAALGSPLANWQHVARAGAAAFVVGALIAALYLWLANREKLFNGSGKHPAKAVSPIPPLQKDNVIESAGVEARRAPAIESTATQFTIESVLDELLSGKITRDEAATRIREMVSTL